jgi:hypothetical protein
LATKTPKETAAIQSFFKYKHYGILDKRKMAEVASDVLAISAIDTLYVLNTADNGTTPTKGAVVLYYQKYKNMVS